MVLDGPQYAGRDEAVLVRAMQLIEADDQVGYHDLVTRREIVELNAWTRLRVIDSEGRVVEARVLNGPAFGELVFIDRGAVVFDDKRTLVGRTAQLDPRVDVAVVSPGVDIEWNDDVAALIVSARIEMQQLCAEMYRLTKRTTAEGGDIILVGSDRIEVVGENGPFLTVRVVSGEHTGVEGQTLDRWFDFSKERPHR